LLIDDTFDIEENICRGIYFDVSIDSKCFDQISKQAGRLVSLSIGIPVMIADGTFDGWRRDGDVKWSAFL
jgi:hypothetical protein